MLDEQEYQNLCNESLTAYGRNMFAESPYTQSTLLNAFIGPNATVRQRLGDDRECVSMALLGFANGITTEQFLNPDLPRAVHTENTSCYLPNILTERGAINAWNAWLPKSSHNDEIVNASRAPLYALYQGFGHNTENNQADDTRFGTQERMAKDGFVQRWRGPSTTREEHPMYIH